MLPETAFSLRLMFADYVLRPPTPLDIQFNPITGERNRRVPVVRIFGSTAGGQTALLHIHRVFPYLYIPYDGQRPLNGFIAFLARELDSKLSALFDGESQRRQPAYSNAKPGNAPNGSPATQHVFRICLVSGTPMYGYYSGERAYLQVSFYNPRDIKQAARLLLSGKVCGTQFQPYEAHIPFVLQFKIDYNLHGMNFVHTYAIRFRKLAPNPFDNVKPKNGGHHDMKIRFDFMNTVENRLMLNDDTLNTSASSSPNSSSSGRSALSLDAQLAAPTLNRFYADSGSRRYLLPQNNTDWYRSTTTCDLECDVLADEIINKMELEMGFECNPGIAFLWKDENRRRALKVSFLEEKYERVKFRSTVPNWLQTWNLTNSEKFWAEQLSTKVTAMKRRLQNYDTEVYNLMQDLLDHVERMQSSELADASWCRDEDDENFSVLNDSYVGSDTTLVENTLGVHVNMSSRAAGGTSDPPQGLLAALPNAATRRTQLPLTVPESQLDSMFSPASSSGNTEMLSPTSPLMLDDEMPTATEDDSVLESQLSIDENFVAAPVEFDADASSEDDEAESWLTPNENAPTFAQLLEENDVPRQTFLLNRSAEQNPSITCDSVKTLTSSLIVSFDDMQHIHQQQLQKRNNPNGFCLIKPIKTYESRYFPKHMLTNSNRTVKQVQEEILTAYDNVNAFRPKRTSREIDEDEQNSYTANDRGLWYAPINAPPSAQQLLHSVSPFRQSSSSPAGEEETSSTQPLDSTINVASKRSKTAACVPTPNRAAREQKPTVHDFQHLITMSVEVFALPLPTTAMTQHIPDYLVRSDPCSDPVVAISYTFLTDYAESIYNFASGMLIVDAVACAAMPKSSSLVIGQNFPFQTKRLKQRLQNLLNDSLTSSKRRVLSIDFVRNEDDLFTALVELVQQADPDLLVGYEIQCESWGYLIQRATAIRRNLMNELSRAPTNWQQPAQQTSGDVDVAAVKYMQRKLSEYTNSISGRVVINLWRLARREITLYRYSFENVVRHVLQRRVPAYSYVTLSQWFYAGYHSSRQSMSSSRQQVQCKLSNPNFARFCDYLINRSLLNLLLLDKMDVIRQTAEQARLYGIQFHEVLTRGSQFRVESMMLRLAKPLNYVPVSPSTQQLMQMMAPEGLPLIMEPESRIYSDPVLVLDFQSLYPSMVIAYNYCFSTCLGKIDLFPTTQAAHGRSPPFKFGCTQMTISAQELIELEKFVNISPAGVAFVKPSVRKGVLPRMLDEILGTRIMVKKAMSAAASESNVYAERVLNARQLALKLIANVTFGYTSANFSGRMPCAEISDSIIERAKETLQRAIRLVEDPRRGWGARVVYGDTDSMFVLLKGRSKLEAFEIGEQIARAVSADNPEPVKLKFEKVYMPCVLMSKKRYVGWKFESVLQAEGVMDAKGIETVRRDQCPLMARTLRTVLEMLFQRRSELGELRQFVTGVFKQLIANEIPVDELVYAKEYRGSGAYKPRAQVPANEIAKRMLRLHRALEPRVGERVPYIVSEGVKGDTIIKLVVTPEEFLSRLPKIRVHARYYGYNVIAQTLNRVLNLFGVDAKRWWFDAIRVVPPGAQNNMDVKTFSTTKLMNAIEDDVMALGICNLYLKNKGDASGSQSSESGEDTDDDADKLNQRKDEAKLEASHALLWHTVKSHYMRYLKLCSACMGHRAFGLDESHRPSRAASSTRSALALRPRKDALELMRNLVSHECVSTACPVLYERVKSWKQCELLTLAFLKTREAKLFFQQINVASEFDW